MRDRSVPLQGFECRSWLSGGHHTRERAYPVRKCEPGKATVEDRPKARYGVGTMPGDIGFDELRALVRACDPMLPLSPNDPFYVPFDEGEPTRGSEGERGVELRSTATSTSTLWQSPPGKWHAERPARLWAFHGRRVARCTERGRTSSLLAW